MKKSDYKRFGLFGVTEDGQGVLLTSAEGHFALYDKDIARVFGRMAMVMDAADWEIVRMALENHDKSR